MICSKHGPWSLERGAHCPMCVRLGEVGAHEVTDESCPHCAAYAHALAASRAHREDAEDALRDLRRELARYRQALEEIAADGCWYTVHSTGKTCRDVYERIRWCRSCIAVEALERGEP